MTQVPVRKGGPAHPAALNNHLVREALLKLMPGPQLV
jgi:hypothetical protein